MKIDFRIIFFVLSALLSLHGVAYAESEQIDSHKVIEAFSAQNEELGEAVVISDEKKHQIMFIMGIPLLILLLVSAALGVAMGIYGKPVFLAHMICAGMTLFLAIAHSVVGFVWFYPF